jgi:RNA polymerase sigma factor (sigma-70 family)
MRAEDTAYETYKLNPCDETQGALYKCILSQARNVIYMVLHRERMDLAANAATYAVLNLEQFLENSAFSTWSHRIARNVAYTEAKRLNEKKESCLEDISPEHMPLDIGLTGYAAVLLEDIKKSLEPVDKQIFEGKLFGLSEEEIAEQTNLTEGAVKMRWLRMKEQILELMKRS